MTAGAASNPHKIVEDVVRKLPNRPQEVIVKRFGLVDGVRRTLEAIGREHGITRERVRQIEVEGLRQLRDPKRARHLDPHVERLRSYITERGNVVRESQIFGELGREFGSQFADASHYHPTLYFLLTYGDPFRRMSESQKYHAAWTTDIGTYQRAGKAIERLVKELEGVRHAHSESELHQTFQKVCAPLFRRSLPREVLAAYIATSRDIHQNPFGEYGLRHWSAVNPRGVRDKAYLVLKRLQKPLHFTEVTREINCAGFNARTAHSQTVHNELIKDPRFILVGRGMYALRDWGYEPGTVREILTKILRQSHGPLTRDEIIKKVTEQRFVKPNTIVLNLQNRNYFRRDGTGRYTISAL